MSRLITEVLVREGGYVVDQGGPTNYGITIPKYSEYLGRQATIQDIKNLTPEKARLVYEWMFKLNGLHLITNYNMLDLLLDCMVNHGERTAIRWMQGFAGVARDGWIGPITAEAVNNNYRKVYYRMLSFRLRFYSDLASKAKHKDSLRGWVNRASYFVKEI